MRHLPSPDPSDVYCSFVAASTNCRTHHHGGDKWSACGEQVVRLVGEYGIFVQLVCKRRPLNKHGKRHAILFRGLHTSVTAPVEHLRGSHVGSGHCTGDGAGLPDELLLACVIHATRSRQLAARATRLRMPVQRRTWRDPWKDCSGRNVAFARHPRCVETV